MPSYGDPASLNYQTQQYLPYPTSQIDNKSQQFQENEQQQPPQLYQQSQYVPQNLPDGSLGQQNNNPYPTQQQQHFLSQPAVSQQLPQYQTQPSQETPVQGNLQSQQNPQPNPQYTNQIGNDPSRKQQPIYSNQQLPQLNAFTNQLQPNSQFIPQPPQDSAGQPVIYTTQQQTQFNKQDPTHNQQQPVQYATQNSQDPIPYNQQQPVQYTAQNTQNPQNPQDPSGQKQFYTQQPLFTPQPSQQTPFINVNNQEQTTSQQPTTLPASFAPFADISSGVPQGQGQQPGNYVNIPAVSQPNNAQYQNGQPQPQLSHPPPSQSPSPQPPSQNSSQPQFMPPQQAYVSCYPPQQVNQQQGATGYSVTPVAHQEYAQYS